MAQTSLQRFCKSAPLYQKALTVLTSLIKSILKMVFNFLIGYSVLTNVISFKNPFGLRKLARTTAGSGASAIVRFFFQDFELRISVYYCISWPVVTAEVLILYFNPDISDFN